MREQSRLAVLGAGHVGPVIARLAVKAGYRVSIATSGDPDDIALGYHDLEDWARPPGAPDRQAAGVAGDDAAAVAAIADLIDRIGYDPVRLDSLRAGRALQPGGPVFGSVLTRPEFDRAMSEETRSLT